MKTMKKSILSLILVCAILANVFALSTVSVSAASSPRLDLVRGSDCFNVVWNKVSGAVKYRLYFGAVSPNGNGWRRFTVLTQSDISTYPKNTASWQFLINSNSLSKRKWYAYGDDKNISTPSLKTTECYQCQVEALGAGDKHIAWTNVDYVFLGSPQNISNYGNDVYVDHPILSVGSVCYIYQIAFKKSTNDTYVKESYRTYKSSSIPIPVPAGSYYQIRIIVYKDNKMLAEGPWSKTRRAY